MNMPKNGSLDKYIEDPSLCKRLTWRKEVWVMVP